MTRHMARYSCVGSAASSVALRGRSGWRGGSSSGLVTSGLSWGSVSLDRKSSMDRRRRRAASACAAVAAADDDEEEEEEEEEEEDAAADAADGGGNGDDVGSEARAYAWLLCFWAMPSKRVASGWDITIFKPKRSTTHRRRMLVRKRSWVMLPTERDVSARPLS